MICLRTCETESFIAGCSFKFRLIKANLQITYTHFINESFVEIN